MHKCKYCKKNIKNKSKNIFCNSSCSASYNNRGKRRHGKSKSNCLNCNNITKASGRIYCSNKCQTELAHKRFIEHWLSGVIKWQSEQLSDHIRNWLLEKVNYKCELCAWSEINPKTGKSPLIADHIDGNPYNSMPNNLRILCPNCDSLTSTYKSLNRGKGRYSRRQRYKEGKSF